MANVWKAWSTGFPCRTGGHGQDEAATARTAKGSSAFVAGIADQLNAEGHRNRAGRQWSAQLVHHVVGSS